MSRSALVVAFYYWFNASEVRKMQRESEDTTPVLQMSFSEYFSYFKMKLEPYLQGAFYQSLNIKNFFDVLVVLSSYYYIYDNCTAAALTIEAGKIQDFGEGKRGNR